MGEETLADRAREARVIAVVDDDPLVLRSTGRLIRSLGHRAVLFDDPRAASTLLPPSTVDAVVLDFDMPKMNGAQLARRLRDHAESRRTPLLLLTGGPERLGADDRALFDSIHRKPIRRTELDRALASALGAEREPSSRLREQPRQGGRRPRGAGVD